MPSGEVRAAVGHVSHQAPLGESAQHGRHAGWVHALCVGQGLCGDAVLPSKKVHLLEIVLGAWREGVPGHARSMARLDNILGEANTKLC